MVSTKETKTATLILAVILMGIVSMSAASAATDEEINQSTTEGVEWLVTQQNADGSFGTSDLIGSTEFAVMKLETHATENGQSPFDPDYQYSDEVQKGLNYLFLNAKQATITNQPAGNPDSNSDGVGIYWGLSTNDYRVMYQTGLGLSTITAGQDPDRVINVPGSIVNGQTYGTVAQNIVDFISWAQNDAGTGRGGWYYVPNTQTGDNSVSGYVTLGLVYAISPANGFNSIVPDFVKTELNIWADYIQSDTTGGSGYNTPGDYYANVYNTGNLIMEFALLGDDATTTRMTAAINFIVNNWNQPGSGYNDIGWRETTPSDITNYVACYSIMKAVQLFYLDTIGGIDWYQDFANAIIPEQNPNGSWPVSKWASNTVLSTCWALLTLEKAAPPIKEADIEVTKTTDTTNPEVGKAFHFIITVINHGPDDATGIIVTDILPAGVTLKGYDAQVGVFDSKTGIWTIDMLGASFSGTLDLEVVADKTGTIVNDVNAVANEFDPNLLDNNASAGVEVVEAAPEPEPEPEPRVTASQSNTVPMQPTGIPLTAMILGILAVLGGTIYSRKQ